MKSNYNLLSKEAKENYRRLTITDIPICTLKCFDAIKKSSAEFLPNPNKQPGNNKEVIFLRSTPKKKIIDELTSNGTLIIYGIRKNKLSDIFNSIVILYTYAEDSRDEEPEENAKLIYEIINEAINDNIKFYESKDKHIEKENDTKEENKVLRYMTNYNLLTNEAKGLYNGLSLEKVKKSIVCIPKTPTALDFRSFELICKESEKENKPIILILESCERTEEEKIIKEYNKISSNSVLIIYGVPENDILMIKLNYLDYHTLGSEALELLKIIDRSIEYTIEKQHAIETNFQFLNSKTKDFLKHCSKLSISEFMDLFEFNINRKGNPTLIFHCDDDRPVIVRLQSSYIAHDELVILANSYKTFVICGIAEDDMNLITQNDKDKLEEQLIKIKEIFDFVVNRSCDNIDEDNEKLEKETLYDNEEAEYYFALLDNKNKYPKIITGSELGSKLKEKHKMYYGCVLVSLSYNYNDNLIKKLFKYTGIILYNRNPFSIKKNASADLANVNITEKVLDGKTTSYEILKILTKAYYPYPANDKNMQKNAANILEFLIGYDMITESNYRFIDTLLSTREKDNLLLFDDIAIELYNYDSIEEWRKAARAKIDVMEINTVNAYQKLYDAIDKIAEYKKTRR